ncbi:13111_t:CDS:10 [Cetraspora pellucida]|uniref:13111_t:CDS:1 n=1 Tax=Cetraspora pellucida TaxID=1433469 RepID=A0ACA9JYJ2_9GLOM|nr:13111_t:CDS:10 [Cetraspora pellucida]
MSSDRYIVSAPGKVILFGEHAVVYGKTAIAGSLDGLRTYAFFEKRIDGYVELNLPDLGLQRAFLWPASALPYNLVNNVDIKEPQNLNFNDVLLHKIKSIALEGQDNQQINNFQQIAAFTFLYLYTCLEYNSQTSCGMTIYVRSNIPVGAGLGSSASYSVCLATGLLLAFGHILSPYESNEQGIKKSSELINLWAYQAEKVIHGTPSGVDNSVATYGGAIMFVNGVIQNMMGTRSLRFLLTNTKVPRNTKILIENVRTRIENVKGFPKITNLILDAIHDISESFKEILGSEIMDDQELYTKTEGLIDMCHHLLNSLGVGHPSLDKVREIAAQCDLHTKLTGAGGGGCALTLIRNDVSKEQIEIVKTALTASPHCFECYETSIGGHGVGVLDASSDKSLQEFSECEKNQLAGIIGWMYFA